MDKTENLLQQVSIIQNKYDEIAKITGENFNIFSIMNMETDEVNTHSAIIGELLNPNGSHGQGSLFLDLFIDYLKNKFNKNHENIKLLKFDKLVNEKICERTISISNNWADVTGGRIDIILEDAKQICIIETKINAVDQDYQLIRYHNYAKKRGKKFYILYLTKDGKSLNDEIKYLQNEYLEEKPSEEIHIEGYNFHYEKKDEYKRHLEFNKDNPSIHQCLYYPISFRDNIKEWLEKCLEKTVSLPLIRETLAQYLYLIKKLTDQSTNKKMENEILDNILNSSQNIESALIIAGIGTEKIKLEICKRLFDKIQNKIGNDLITQNYDSDKLLGQDESGMWFSKKEDFKIGVLLFFNGDCNKLMLGIDVNSIDQFERERILKNNGSRTNWIKTIPFDENFNNLKWEERLVEKNINEIVSKIKELIDEVDTFKTE